MPTTVDSHSTHGLEPMEREAIASSSGSEDSLHALDRHRQWRKVLWEDQSLPDNFVDDSFLASLVTNGANSTTYCNKVLMQVVNGL